jgi:hypothetical protein
MQHLVIRTGSRIRKRLGIFLALAALVIAVVFLLQPPRWFGRPALELVALDAGGLFQDSVSLPRAWADTSFKGAYGATARVPLVFGVRNVGTVEGGARSLRLSLPARYRLESADGHELPHQSETGNPLIRYTIEGPFPPVEPGRMPGVLPAVDTVWLEPIVPQVYCIAGDDSVPEFVPAPEPDPQALSHVQIFFSFEGGVSRGREAGLLSIHLDPSLVARPPAQPPPSFPTRIHEPAWPLPAMGDLRRIGATTARCGPPESPMDVQSTIWQGDGGGRLIVLSYGGRPRKYLFDLDGDSLVDLEMWDPSGHGRFDAERAARFPVPPFLLPPSPPPFDEAVFAGLPADSLSRLYAFRHAGEFRPTTALPDSATALDRFQHAGTYVPRTGQATPSLAGAPGAGGPAQAASGFVRGAPPRAGAGARLLGRPADSSLIRPRPDSGR